MAYQLDYKKVYNTFGPKNKRERYGTEIGKQVNNLMASFNTHLPSRYGQFLNRDESHSANGGIKIFWPEKENTWYHIDYVSTPRNNNFCVGKFLYCIFPNNPSKIEPVQGYFNGVAFNQKTYGYTNAKWQYCKSFINVPVQPGKTYCLQFINNNNIARGEESDSYPELFLFAEGIRDDGQTCIFSCYSGVDSGWIKWHKDIRSDQINFHCFLKIPEKQILSVSKEWNNTNPADDYIKITKYILGIIYPYSYYLEDGSVKTYENMRGFLWESDRPALVDQNGTIIQYVGESWDTWDTLPDEYKLTVMPTEEVKDILLQPYTTIIEDNNEKIRDATAILSVDENNIARVTVPEESETVISPLRKESFRNWLWINKKDLIAFCVRIHEKENDIPRRMIGEKGKKYYSNTKVRRLIGGKGFNGEYVVMPGYSGFWSSNDNDWHFPEISYNSIVNGAVSLLGMDGYTDQNHAYTTIGVCFSVRNKKRSLNGTNPRGGLYIEYLPGYNANYYRNSIRHIDIQEFTTTNYFGDEGVAFITKSIMSSKVSVVATHLPRPHAVDPKQKTFTYTIPTLPGWIIKEYSFDMNNVGYCKLKTSHEIKPMNAFDISYSDNGKTVSFKMRVILDGSEYDPEAWYLTLPYTVTYTR